jgi:3-hydroxybutyrate dehydrogenase
MARHDNDLRCRGRTKEEVGPVSELRGHAALVTGSTSGIGRGIASSLAARGSDVAITGFGDPDEIEARRAAMEAEFETRVIYLEADLTDPGQVADLVEKAGAALGGIDILVNNAGVQHVAPIEEFPLERWDTIIALNLSAVFHATRAAIPTMRERGWGRIVNLVSAHGLVASPYKAAYVSAKHGVIGLTKVAALELANAGVTVNAICPGWVLTPLVEAQVADRAKASGLSFEDEAVKLLSEKQPMHAFTTPEQIGEFTVFLCGDAASTITGASLSIDGGWTAQ